MVHKNGHFYLFGGSGAPSVIAKLEVATKTWAQVGSLIGRQGPQGRFAHAVVVRSNDFIIVGSPYKKMTERCALQNEMQMLCVTVEPKLNNFAFYPEAMLVDENLCASSDPGQDSEEEPDSESSSSRFNAFLLPILTVQAVFW